MEKLRLKQNILGGTVYIPKTPKQIEKELAQLELNSRKEKEKLDAKKSN